MMPYIADVPELPGGAQLDLEGLPEEVRLFCEDAFLRWAPFVPRWCDRIDFIYKEENNEDLHALQILSHPEYHRAVVLVYPAWMEETQEVRRKGAMHEVIFHLHLEPLAAFSRDLLEEQEEGGVLARVLERQRRRLVEFCVEGLTNLFFDRLLQDDSTGEQARLRLLSQQPLQATIFDFHSGEEAAA